MMFSLSSYSVSGGLRLKTRPPRAAIQAGQVAQILSAQPFLARFKNHMKNHTLSSSLDLIEGVYLWKSYDILPPFSVRTSPL
jgi:hypothetical protein